jgi:septum formation protein
MSLPLYLASASPRRLELLRQIGIEPRLLLPDAGEDAEALEQPLAGEAPRAYVQRVARAKFDAAALRLRRRGGPAGVVLAADTTVALGRSILGKPADRAQAVAMLERLSGRRHRVLTAVVAGLAGGPNEAEAPLQALSVSLVRFAPLDRAAIERYVESGEPFGKAGAYALQGRAAAFVQALAGSPSGVIGLPLYETALLLQRLGAELQCG